MQHSTKIFRDIMDIFLLPHILISSTKKNSLTLIHAHLPKYIQCQHATFDSTENFLMKNYCYYSCIPSFTSQLSSNDLFFFLFLFEQGPFETFRHEIFHVQLTCNRKLFLFVLVNHFLKISNESFFKR